MSAQVYDAIVIGAGSVGLPTALFLAEAGVKTLVIDQFAGPGQGSNKAAIGGIRATHSSPAKIRLCLESLRIFSTWEQRHGDDIEWYQGGYVFVAYREQEERSLKDLLTIQQSYGLNIRWLDRDEMLALVPRHQPRGAARRHVLARGRLGVADDVVGGVLPARRRTGRAVPLQRARDRHHPAEERRWSASGPTRAATPSETVINAAGAWARPLAQSAGLDTPVVPDSHEAGITEPVARFLDPMLVDIRPTPGARNYYFYQHKPGGIVFCITPDPPIVGTDRRETSDFLPMIANRMIGLMPKLANIKVRRTWRGLYPMTPDGAPVLGLVEDARGLRARRGHVRPGLHARPRRRRHAEPDGARRGHRRGQGRSSRNCGRTREFEGEETLK